MYEIGKIFFLATILYISMLDVQSGALCSYSEYKKI